MREHVVAIQEEIDKWHGAPADSPPVGMQFTLHGHLNDFNELLEVAVSYTGPSTHAAMETVDLLATLRRKDPRTFEIAMVQQEKFLAFLDSLG
jgi:hypothetical protein